MKMMNSDAEMVIESNPYKLVERVARTCYKSEDKITEDSCYAFVDNLISRHHYAMLEHGRLCYRLQYKPQDSLQVLAGIQALIINIPQIYVVGEIDYGVPSLYISVSMSHIYNPLHQITETHRSFYAILKYLLHAYYRPDKCEQENLDELYQKFFSNIASELDFVLEFIPDCINYMKNRNISFIEDFNMYFDWRTVKFICDRGVSHELVRHRCSVAQESTRYCNYAKAKFGGGDISFIYPHGYDLWKDDIKKDYQSVLTQCEKTYNYMISEGMSPQQARAVLPNSLKTEVVLTMPLYQWKHFFDLRYFGTTGNPHPDMKEVAGKAYQLFDKILDD